jgi:hypothetical protein
MNPETSIGPLADPLAILELEKQVSEQFYLP